jgi:hypothetical protein
MVADRTETKPLAVSEKTKPCIQGHQLLEDIWQCELEKSWIKGNLNPSHKTTIYCIHITSELNQPISNKDRFKSEYSKHI